MHSGIRGGGFMGKKYICFIITAVSLFFTEAVFAGMEYMLKCRNRNCNYSTKVDFGGGLGFGQIMGYCMTCGDFTYLQWESRERMPDGSFSDKMLKGPNPIAKIWDLNTNEPVPVYKCGKCSQPFILIKDVKNITHCPKCLQKSADIEQTGLVYD
jgi:hypothetical protein